MHVYHYASYEPTALKRLMGRHATREDEVDRLLRGGVLVDLFRAVRQSLRASVESYSIKRSSRCTASSARSSCATPAPASWPSRSGSSSARATDPPPTILDEIAAYNRDDVVSTRAPARLARGAARRARERDRPDGPAPDAGVRRRAGATAAAERASRRSRRR